jgi:hypothetical protein
MQRTRTAIAALALLFGAVLFAAGCSSVVPGQAAPAAAPAAPAAPRAAPESAPESAAAPVSPEGVVWADQVCGAFLDANTVLTDQPKPDINNVPGTISVYSQYFDRTLPALDAAMGRLQGIGPGPLDGGATVIDSMVGIMTLMRDAHRSAKAAVDVIDPASPTVLTQELPAALALTQIADSAPQVDISATPQLDAAAAVAPNCQAFGP